MICLGDDNACWVPQYDKGRVVEEIPAISDDYATLVNRACRCERVLFPRYALGKYAARGQTEILRGAYEALGGMGKITPRDVKAEDESRDEIGNAIQRRVSSGPLAGDGSAK